MHDEWKIRMPFTLAIAQTLGRWCFHLSRALPCAPATVTLVAALSLGLAACQTSAGPAQSDIAEAPGAVELNQGPLSDSLPGGGGTGTVFFRGTLYQFNIGGLGVEGSAIAILETSGRVYRLHDISRFAGNYRRAPASSIIPGEPAGGLWLQNESATVMYLADPPQGRMPDIGTDAVRVVLNE